MEPINVFFQPCKQPLITTTTKQSMAEPSVSAPPIYQKQLTLVLNLSSADKRQALSLEGVSELFEVMFLGSQLKTSKWVELR